MVRRFSFLLFLLVFVGCDINRKNLIVQKRIFLKGYYVHVPGKRSDYPAVYLPPHPYPTIVNRTVAGHPDRTVADSSQGAVYQPAYVQQSATNYPGGYVYGNNPVQQQPQYYYPGNGGYNPATGNGMGTATGVGVGNQPDPLYHPYKLSEIPVYDTSTTPYRPIVYNDTVPPALPTDTAMAYQPPSHHKQVYFPDVQPGAYAQMGMMIGMQDYGKQVKWNSFSFSAGMRNKMAINSHQSLVADLGYRFNQFFIGQNAPKLFPLSQQKHDRERVSINDFTIAFCDRIDFNEVNDDDAKETNWLDVGMYADASFRTSNVYYDKFQNSNSAVGRNYKIKTKITDLNFLNHVDYGLTVRYGFKYCNVFATYRLNDLIRFSSAPDNYRDLPRLAIGVEMDTF